MNAQQQAQADRERMQRPAWQGRNYIEIMKPASSSPAQFQPMPASPSEDSRQAKRITTITPEGVAQAFVIRTRVIAPMTGGAVALIWLLVRWALPLTTGAATVGLVAVGVSAILAGVAMFFVVWLLAYIIDMALSPGAVEMIEASRTQRRLDEQSRALVDAYRKHNQIEDRSNGTD